MAVIRCKGKLWERLGGRRATQTGHQAAIPGVLLGSWAAKVFKCESRHLVVAVNERTYLTVVFPLGPSERFAAELRSHVNAISHHAFETSKIAQSFAAGWYNNHIKNKTPSDREIQAFLSTAFGKIREELQRERS